MKELTVEEVIEFLNKSSRHRFCLVDYSGDTHYHYEIIYKIHKNKIFRKKWDTINWHKTRFEPVDKDVIVKDIDKGNRFNNSKNYNKYTKLYKYDG